MQPLAAGNRDGQSPFCLDVDAERGERPLGVVACLRRFGDRGRPLRVQPGQQDRALHLRARHLGPMRRWRGVPRRESSAAHGRRSPRSGAPIRVERLDDAAHRTAGQRRVADHREAHEGLGPASRPASILIVVPELPASSGPAGERKPRNPRPTTVTAPRCVVVGSRRRAGGGRRASTGNRRRARNSPGATRPSASAAMSAYRWEIDLSPGTRTRPWTCRAGDDGGGRGGGIAEDLTSATARLTRS